MRIGFWTLVAVAAALIAPGCTSDWDGWVNYVESVRADSPTTTMTSPAAEIWGTTLVVDFLVKDPGSRTVQVSLQFSLDGGNFWFDATAAAGSQNPQSLLANPAGVAGQVEWDHAADLGIFYRTGVLIRVQPQNPTGTSGLSNPIDITSYESLTAAELRAELYPDLMDGALDGIAVVDTRGDAALNLESVPGAFAITLADVTAMGIDAYKFPDGTPIPSDYRLVFYCAGGT